MVAHWCGNLIVASNVSHFVAIEVILLILGADGPPGHVHQVSGLHKPGLCTGGTGLLIGARM